MRWDLWPATATGDMGLPVFELATLPAPPGRALAGHVVVSTGLEPDREMSIRLRCLRRTVTGSGKNRKTHETTLWEDQRRIPGAIRSGECVKIPVAIPIRLTLRRPTSAFSPIACCGGSRCVRSHPASTFWPSLRCRYSALRKATHHSRPRNCRASVDRFAASAFLLSHYHSHYHASLQSRSYTGAYARINANCRGLRGS